ncbi:hypothetical protein GQ457_03G033950 [Hibiscus cannabinus]
MGENGNRAEAIRLLGIAEKLLQSGDFNGSRDFAILAQETEPLLDGSDQILAIVDVILAAEKKINNHQDLYSILQIDGRSDDNDLIKKQYRRLALLLHPDKNKFPFADHAFKLVADAWAILSNSSKKSFYDKKLSLFTRIDLSGGNLSNQAGKLPVSRSGQNQERGQYWIPNANTQHENQRSKTSTFWTACPYCYRLFEYPRAYEGCCLRCHNCEKAFHAVDIPTLPPLVPGKEAYYCCWAFFPLGFVSGSPESEGKFHCEAVSEDIGEPRRKNKADAETMQCWRANFVGFLQLCEVLLVKCTKLHSDLHKSLQNEWFNRES